ncbi:hypothetical protein [Cohnella abietis]|uniref:DUF5643 domain-containing protein n=1 Tax=Cohnella abietis TaxID=2507935 RepID=A0A3T1DAA7_9BACL|nr:hypothetical protein [Cohnella abietis]BBI34908.1 hypothetical protein KCTCHS21_43070 [Cohnella abietis]
MKKFIIGFAWWAILLTITTGAVAASSSKIQAVETSVNIDKPVVNNLLTIDMKNRLDGGSFAISEKKLIFRDKDNFVRIGYLKEISKKKINNKNRIIYTGIIKINKSLTNKMVRIVGLDNKGESISTLGYVAINQQYEKPPETGDIRSFRTEITADAKIESFQVTVIDFIEQGNFSDVDTDAIDMFGTPSINFDLLKEMYNLKTYKTNNKNINALIGNLDQGQIIPLDISIVNTSGSDLTLIKPFKVTFTVSKITKNGQARVVFQKPLVSLIGEWKSKDYYRANFYWDLLNNPLEKGIYKISLKSVIATYTIDQKHEVKTYNVAQENNPMDPDELYVVIR